MTLSTAGSPSRIVGRVKRTFAPTGHLALLPAAFGFMFDECAPERPDVQGGTAIVKIRGPLMHHASWWGDSYDAIAGRVADALDALDRGDSQGATPVGYRTPARSASAKALLLCIDSPGGTVSGLFECARSIREMAESRGVPVYAYVEGQACSAAYALACAADVIGCPPTAQVGSIGVIGTLYSVAEANAKQGIRVELVTSGARKADGNPHGEITPEAIAAEQASVDELAGMFFEHVAQSRGLSADAVRGFEAGVFLGAEAVERKLADQVVTFAEMLALVASAPTKERSMKAEKVGAKASKEMDGAIETLRKLAESDDEEEAKKAKKLLAAFEDEGEEETDDDEKDEEEASAKRALPLALKRIESLEAESAARAQADREATVERDVAAGKIATCDRETALALLEKDAKLYAKIYGAARAVPVGTVAKGGRAGSALDANGRIDEKALSADDALLVRSMRAAQLSEKAIKKALSERGTEV